MVHRPRLTRARLLAGLLAAGSFVVASGASAQSDEEGFPIDHETIRARCAACHLPDSEGRMSRISFERKTPEGWQGSLQRMISLNGVTLAPEEAREIVKYLSDHQGLAPEELRPGLFEVERRMIDHRYLADTDVEFTCIQCHSMGRVITQRRTREEWELLMSTHRGYYPLADFQAFLRMGPTPDQPGPDGEPPDTRQPMERAVDHLSEVFPLHTPEWAAWSATMRPSRLEGTWVMSGHQPGRGALYGTVTMGDGGEQDAFVTRASYTFPATGETVTRRGRGLVYTGYQWRGRSFESDEADGAMREVMLVERGMNEISGRWFRGDYDEIGMDVRLTRVAGSPVVAGVHPRALQLGGGEREVRIFGAGFADGVGPGDVDLGPGLTVNRVVSASSDEITLNVTLAPDAAPGGRDVFVGGGSLAQAVVVHDGIDRIQVLPRTGMARVGGIVFPKGYQQFEAVAFDDGPDGRPSSDDDLELGPVEVDWSLEEYAATFDDNDIEFVGSIDQTGLFVPAADGPNPDRDRNRNNVGDVWVVATLAQDDNGDRPLRARAHLVVTVPLYLLFDAGANVSTGASPDPAASSNGRGSRTPGPNPGMGRSPQ
ncbi:MAG: quinohemoprotein amine dehydrogenase subunit alpha [Gammaproteobacteria bacterium]|nr:quinohemoprotein amine dehydrogenase subunit alpha [Gammaproteobacteria bacterium]